MYRRSRVLTEAMQDALATELIALAHEEADGLDVCAVEQDVPRKLAEALIWLVDGVRHTSLQESSLTEASVAFLRNYFMLDSTRRIRAATRDLGTIIENLIIQGRLQVSFCRTVSLPKGDILIFRVNAVVSVYERK